MPAAVANRKKSYHSIVVPISDAIRTVRGLVLVSSGATAGAVVLMGVLCSGGGAGRGAQHARQRWLARRPKSTWRRATRNGRNAGTRKPCHPGRAVSSADARRVSFTAGAFGRE